jgi:hypothetical protein
VIGDHLFEDVPDLLVLALEHLLGALDRVGVPSSLSLRMMNGWYSSSAIFLGRPHWCSFQFGADDDHERAE